MLGLNEGWVTRVVGCPCRDRESDSNAELVEDCVRDFERTSLGGASDELNWACLPRGVAVDDDDAEEDGILAWLVFRDGEADDRLPFTVEGTTVCVDVVDNEDDDEDEEGAGE